MKLSTLILKVANRTASKSEYKECVKRIDLKGFSPLRNSLVDSFLNLHNLQNLYNDLVYNNPEICYFQNRIGKSFIL